jgi:hypothetical protein
MSQIRKGGCAEPGPYATHCTDYPVTGTAATTGARMCRSTIGRTSATTAMTPAATASTSPTKEIEGGARQLAHQPARLSRFHACGPT